MSFGTVIGLWRYPASSLGGEPMRELTITAGGVDGDRLFGLFDRASGEIARPDADKKWHPVPRIRSKLNAVRELEVATPDGAWLPAKDDVAVRSMSDFLGFEAVVREFGEPATAHPTAEPRYAKAPIHLLTTASMARLKALHPEGNPDPRRFRPNILVEMPEVEGSFPETEWIGRRLRVGEVELTISEPCRRCGFTIIAQDGFEDDPGILRNLLRHNSRNIGVYCTVDRPGMIDLSAEVTLLD